MEFDALPQDFFRHIDEINRVVQAFEAIWGPVDSCLSSAEVAMKQLRASEDALASSVLAQVARLDDGQADATAAMQGLLQSQIAIPALADFHAQIITQPTETATAIQAKFDAWRADTHEIGKSLLKYNEALTDGVLASVRHFEDTSENAAAALRRLQENQVAVAAQVNLSPIVAAMASIQQPDWSSQVSLVKTCFEEAGMLRELGSTSSGLPIYIQSLLDSQRALESAYGRDLQAVLRWNVEDAIGPALAALRGGLVQPDFGLMAGDEMGGLLTWEGAFGHDRSLISAPLLPAAFGRYTRPTARLLRVRCNVICRWCGEPLIASGGDQIVDAASVDLILDLTVVPLCPKCLERAAADPTYLERCIGETSESAASQFKLIRGEAEGTTAPRGRSVLHLVKLHQEFEDD